MKTADLISKPAAFFVACGSILLACCLPLLGRWAYVADPIGLVGEEGRYGQPEPYAACLVVTVLALATACGAFSAFMFGYAFTEDAS